MASSSSLRPTREWPLLVLAIALVCSATIPLWQASESWSEGPGWTAKRFARLFLGPAQITCYVAFTWGCFILGSRYWEVLRQRRAFGYDLLPTEVGVCILPEDARLLQRKVDQKTGGKPFILANMIRLALNKYA